MHESFSGARLLGLGRPLLKYRLRLAAVQALVRGIDETPDLRHTHHLCVLFL